MIYRLLLTPIVLLLLSSATNLKAGNCSPGYARIVSYEDTNLTEQLSIQVWYHFQDSVKFGDTATFYTQDSTWSLSPSSVVQLNSMNSTITYSPGDSVSKTYQLSYDTAAAYSKTLDHTLNIILNSIIFTE